MKKIIVLLMLAFVVSAVAETDYVAMDALKRIREGTADSRYRIETLYVGGDATIAGDIAPVGGVAFPVATAVTVTNGQAVTLVAGSLNVLRASGGAATTTNVITFADFATADVGKPTWVANASLVTNKLSVVKTGNWLGATVVLDVGESLTVFPAAAGSLYSPGK